MDNLLLTPLTAALLQDAVDLDQLIFGHCWSYQGYQQEVERPESDLLVLICREALASATIGDEYNPSDWVPPLKLLGIGCVWTILDEAHVTLLGIHPDYQGQGLGQTLLLGLLEAAHHRKMGRATLEVRASNQTAQSLYAKFGFELVGQRPNYYANPHEDGLLFWRSGLQTTAFKRQLQRWQAETQLRLNQSGWHNWHIHLH